MKTIQKTLRNIVSDNSGATAIEYALIAAVIAVASITAMQAVGSSVAGSFQASANALKK